MFQNNITFIYKDIDQDTENIGTVIKELMMEYLEESVSAPYFCDEEIEYFEEGALPLHWDYEINKKLDVPEDKIRLTIAKESLKASRHFEDYLNVFDMALMDPDCIKLVAQSIGSIDLWEQKRMENGMPGGQLDIGVFAITRIDAPYDEENDLSLLDLISASGDSPVKISVTPGAKWNFKTMTFSCPGKYTDSHDDFVLDNSAVEKIFNFIKALERTLKSLEPSTDEIITRQDQYKEESLLAKRLKTAFDKDGDMTVSEKVSPFQTLQVSRSGDEKDKEYLIELELITEDKDGDEEFELINNYGSDSFDEIINDFCKRGGSIQTIENIFSE